MDTNAQQALLDELVALLAPFREFAQSPAERRRAFGALGWNADALDATSLGQLAQGLGQIYTAIEGLAEKPPQSLDDLVQVLSALGQAIDGIRKIAAAAGSSASFPADLGRIGTDLLELYLTEYLMLYHPTAYRTAVLLTLVREAKDMDPASLPAPLRNGDLTLFSPLPRATLRIENLPALLQDPLGYLKQEYFPTGLQTDSDAFAGSDRLFPRVRDFVNTFSSLQSHYGMPSGFPDGSDDDDSDALVAPPPDSAGVSLVKHTFTVRTNPALFSSVSDDGTKTTVDFGASMLLTPSTNPDFGAALVIGPFGAFTVDIPIGQWHIKAGLDVAPGGFAIGERGLTVLIDNQNTHIQGDIGLSKVAGDDGTPAFLIGSTTGTRLALSSVGIDLSVDGSPSDLDVGFLFKVDKSSLVISAGDGDGFLQKVLPKDGFSVNFNLAFGWSRKKGVYFDGGAGFEVTLPVNFSLAGIVTVDSISLGLAVAKEGLKLGAGLSAGVNIGPVAASIEKMGIQFKLAFQPGNLGPLDLQVGFKPPSGIGMVIDAGPVTGGGYISFDPDNGRYAGVLQLKLYSIGITAIGLLDTKLPGGENGFSFLIIIAVEFTPIQLGFGFTLNGIGGLAGINRTIQTDLLRDGLRSHSLDNILFPKDPVKRATQLISDLRAIFPPAEGRYVFGPMIKLGWGTFVEAELGVILEVPSPVRIVIMGQLNAVFPTKELAIIELHLDVLGIIDFGQCLFSLDASLHDSRVAMFNISGDMAMRLSWGDSPSFALSLGGLNPHFQPPPNFPKLRRLCISLGSGDNPRLSLEAYFGLTSNSFQFGAALDLYVALGPLSIKGALGFDALFIFNPFSFIIDLEVLLEVKFGNLTLLGIHLKGSLSGPTPWHVVGDASLTVLFFEVSVHVDATFGDQPQQAALLEVDPWPQLNAAIADPRNWNATLGPATLQVVTLSAPEGAAAPLLVDPMGGATLREKVVPLNWPIRKFGEARPAGPGRYDLSSVKVGDQAVTTTLVQDHFAPAQFRDMTDAEKVQSPSFVDMPAGFTLSDDAVLQGVGIAAVVDYTTRVVTAPGRATDGDSYCMPLAQQLANDSSSGAAAAAPLRTTGAGKYAVPGAAPLVAVDDEQYVVSPIAVLKPRLDIAAPGPYGRVQAALADYLNTKPAERGMYQLIALADTEMAA